MSSDREQRENEMIATLLTDADRQRHEFFQRHRGCVADDEFSVEGTGTYTRFRCTGCGATSDVAGLSARLFAAYLRQFRCANLREIIPARGSDRSN